MFEKKILAFLLCLAAVLGWVAGTRWGNVLFISAMDDAIEPGGSDDVLNVFTEGLGHTVTNLVAGPFGRLRASLSARLDRERRY